MYYNLEEMDFKARKYDNGTFCSTENTDFYTFIPLTLKSTFLYNLTDLKINYIKAIFKMTLRN